MLPVVFVQGIRVSRAAWVSQVATVGAHHPVSAIDLPGHGANMDVPFTMRTAVAEVVAAIGDAPALVVGHSLGQLLDRDVAMSLEGSRKAVIFRYRHATDSIG